MSDSSTYDTSERLLGLLHNLIGPEAQIGGRESHARDLYIHQKVGTVWNIYENLPEIGL
jgi:hypothetical protein